MTTWYNWLQGQSAAGNNLPNSNYPASQELANINQDAAQQNQSPELLAQTLGNESSFNPYATNSGSTATGLGQTLSGTAANPGYGISPLSDPTDPAQSTLFTSQYLAANPNGYATLSSSEAQLGTTQTGSYQGITSVSGSNDSAPWDSATVQDYSANNTGSTAEYATAETSAVAGAYGSTVVGINPAVTSAQIQAIQASAGQQASATTAAGQTEASGFFSGITDAANNIVNEFENLFERGGLILIALVLGGIALWWIFASTDVGKASTQAVGEAAVAA